VDKYEPGGLCVIKENYGGKMSGINSSLDYLRTLLGVRMARLRVAARENDRGASAVELAVITAVILVIAGLILAAIKTFVTSESNQIQAP
jgi:Flp pilus assembly pilin Flp